MKLNLSLSPRPEYKEKPKTLRECILEDLEKAGMLYLQAAKGGSVNAQYVIGLWYLDGLFNFPKNENEALFWFKKAASQGHVKAQIKVAELEN